MPSVNGRRNEWPVRCVDFRTDKYLNVFECLFDGEIGEYIPQEEAYLFMLFSPELWLMVPETEEEGPQGSEDPAIQASLTEKGIV